MTTQSNFNIDWTSFMTGMVSMVAIGAIAKAIPAMLTKGKQVFKRWKHHPVTGEDYYGYYYGYESGSKNLYRPERRFLGQ